MLSLLILVVLLGTAVNAGFFHKHHFMHKHFTIDMNGFHHGYNHDHGFHGGFMFSKHKEFGSPPPVYGPPSPFPQNVHHPQSPDFHGPDFHGPDFNHQHGVGFGPPNTIPFNPWPSNIPFFPPNIFNTPNSNYPHQFGGAIPPMTQHNHFGFNPSNQPTTSSTNVIPNIQPTFNGNSPYDPNSVFVEISTNPSNGNSFGTESDVYNRPNSDQPKISPNENSGNIQCIICIQYFWSDLLRNDGIIECALCMLCRLLTS